MVESPESKMHEEQLRSLGLFSVEKKRLSGNLITAYSSLQGKKKGSADLCFLLTDTGSKGTAWSCIRGGLSRELGKGSSPRQWSGTGTSSQGQWPQP